MKSCVVCLQAPLLCACAAVEDPVATRVAPGLWISGVLALDDERFMRGINAVVTAFPLNHYDVDEQELSAKLEGKRRLRVPIMDDPNAPIELYFESTARWIEKQINRGYNVLLHCFKGRSRSVALAAYYLTTRMAELYPTVDDALSYIHKLRPSVHPNEGFVKKLHGYTQ